MSWRDKPNGAILELWDKAVQEVATFIGEEVEMDLGPLDNDYPNKAKEQHPDSDVWNAWLADPPTLKPPVIEPVYGTLSKADIVNSMGLSGIIKEEIIQGSPIDLEWAEEQGRRIESLLKHIESIAPHNFLLWVMRDKLTLNIFKTAMIAILIGIWMLPYADSLRQINDLRAEVEDLKIEQRIQRVQLRSNRKLLKRYEDVDNN